MDIAITYEADGAGFDSQRGKTFSYTFHNQKCKKRKCWKVKFTSNEEITLKN